MPIFQYKAKKGTQTITGQIGAQSQDEAIELMSQQGLLPVSIQEKTFAPKQTAGRKRGRIRPREVFVFTRQLAGLIRSGIPILRALNIVGEQTPNAYFRDIINAMERGIKDGGSLSDCLSIYPDVFSGLYIAMIRVGEEGGRLKEALARIAEYQGAQQEISSKVRSAIAYPILMAVVGISTVIFILTFVMPRIIPLFSNITEQLPLPTKILMGISDFLRQGWMVILLVLFIAVFFFKRWFRTDTGKAALSAFKLRFPFMGGFILKVELARFCRTLELLLKSGIPLPKGMQVATPTLDNALLKTDFLRCHKDLESGVSFANSLEKSKYTSRLMVNMIAVGEESGFLEEALGDVATTYEQETNETIKIMTTLLEPAMILIVGLVVGFIVIAMLLPIFQMDILAR